MATATDKPTVVPASPVAGIDRDLLREAYNKALFHMSGGEANKARAVAATYPTFEQATDDQLEIGRAHV